MKFVQCDIPKAGERRGYTDMFKVLTEFVDSGIKCAKIVDYTNLSSFNCYTSLHRAAKEFKFYQVTVRYIGDNVYLIRKDI